MTEIEFAALLVSRVCHDLVGPLGAVVNGMEVLEDERDPAMRADAIKLVTMSADQAFDQRHVRAQRQHFRVGEYLNGRDMVGVSVSEQDRLDRFGANLTPRKLSQDGFAGFVIARVD